MEVFRKSASQLPSANCVSCQTLVKPSNWPKINVESWKGYKYDKSKTLLTSNTGGVVISELEAQDIDNEIDWKMAELKFKLR